MSTDPSEATRQIVPMLVYEDAEEAIAFLCRAFGFAERYRLPMPDGRIGHAELVCGGSLVMLASEYPEMGLVSPRRLPMRHAQLHCSVDDVDAHYARARAAGAVVTGGPGAPAHGRRSYRALDPEGNRWIFAGPASA